MTKHTNFELKIFFPNLLAATADILLAKSAAVQVFAIFVFGQSKAPFKK